MAIQSQRLLFPLWGDESPKVNHAKSSTFVDNMKLPVHRWFRFSAGFSAEWVETVLSESDQDGQLVMLDPFAGSATSLIAAECAGVRSYGIESHPLVHRIARAKLAYRSDAGAFSARIEAVLRSARRRSPEI